MGLERFARTTANPIATRNIDRRKTEYIYMLNIQEGDGQRR
jgi:hypothetical protein